jgi:hypothetical protein
MNQGNQGLRKATIIVWYNWRASVAWQTAEFGTTNFALAKKFASAAAHYFRLESSRSTMGMRHCKAYLRTGEARLQRLGGTV